MYLAQTVNLMFLTNLMFHAQFNAQFHAVPRSLMFLTFTQFHAVPRSFTPNLMFLTVLLAQTRRTRKH